MNYSLIQTILLPLALGVVILFYIGKKGYEFWRETRPNIIRIEMLMPEGYWKIYPLTPIQNGKVKFPHGTYNIDTACINRKGWLRIPTIHYVYKKFAPLDFAKMALSSSLSSSEYKEQTEGHTARDAINAFSTNILTQPMIIMLIVALGVLGVVWYTGNSNTESLRTEIRQLLPTPQPIPTSYGEIK